MKIKEMKCVFLQKYHQNMCWILLLAVRYYVNRQEMSLRQGTDKLSDDPHIAVY